jgi:RimJ/RimL family protein N-acetyltransferase
MPGATAAAATGSPDETVVVIDPTLSDSRALSVLTLPHARALLTVSPQWAHTLGVAADEILDTSGVDDRLRAAGVHLNDPDALHYLPAGVVAAANASDDHRSTRRLTPDDADAFARFTAAAPDDDLDEAFVGLDHWLAFGTFVEGELAAAASAYPWGETLLADIGVITLPASRGRGLGRDTVRAISAAARALGYEPQYRCQLDNAPSVAVAEAAGFVHFGQWRVILPAADSAA